VVHSLAPVLGRFDGDSKLLARMRLPGEIFETSGAKRGFELTFVLLRCG
jgi:hypothetical protein